MRRDARFWRNVALITLLHVVGLIALLRWAGASKIESAQEITWLSVDEGTSASVDSPTPEETPLPEKPAPPEENQSMPAPAKSEIQLPTATPHPTPSATATPNPSPRTSPKPSPKKKTSPKPTPSS
jgi:outer membrane biosynthesis protein TonB